MPRRKSENAEHKTPDHSLAFSHRTCSENVQVLKGTFYRVTGPDISQRVLRGADLMPETDLDSCYRVAEGILADAIAQDESCRSVSHTMRGWLRSENRAWGPRACGGL